MRDSLIGNVRVKFTVLTKDGLVVEMCSFDRVLAGAFMGIKGVHGNLILPRQSFPQRGFLLPLASAPPAMPRRAPRPPARRGP